MAIYDVGLDQEPPYIVAELVPGESLRDVINKGPVPVRKAVDIAAKSPPAWPPHMPRVSSTVTSRPANARSARGDSRRRNHANEYH